MRLTPAILAASYEFLRKTPPFDQWKLPPSHSIKFVVTKSLTVQGDHDILPSKKHRVRISGALISHTENLISTMAHEMIHVHLDRRGVKSAHGAEFKSHAKRICSVHGFDPKLF